MHQIIVLCQLSVINKLNKKKETNQFQISNIKYTLINFDWTNLKTENKRSFLIVTIFMNKNFGIKMVNGSELSLLTMTTVSYYNNYYIILTAAVT